MWRISSKGQNEREHNLCGCNDFVLRGFISYCNAQINSLDPSNPTRNCLPCYNLYRFDSTDTTQRNGSASFLHWECLLLIWFSQLSWGTSLRYSRGLPYLTFERRRSAAVYLWCHNFYFSRAHRVQWNRKLHLLLKNTHRHTQTCWSHWYQSKVPYLEASDSAAFYLQMLHSM